MLNDPLIVFLEAVDAGRLSESLCSLCLDSPWGDPCEAMQIQWGGSGAGEGPSSRASGGVHQEALDELYHSYKKLLQQGEIDFLQSHFPTARRVAAVCLSMAKSNGGIYQRMAAARQLLLMAQVPGAKGQGISSDNVLEHISGLVLKIALDEMSAANRKQLDDGIDDGDEEDATDLMDGANSETTTLRSALSSSCSCLRCAALVSTRDKVNTTPLTCLRNQALFTAFFDEYSSSASLFKGSSSSEGTHSILESFIDGLIAVLYLGSCMSTFNEAKEVAHASLVDVVASSASAKEASATSSVYEQGYRAFDTPGLMCVYKLLLPCLTFSGHDVKIPAESKSRIACHRVAASVIKSIISRMDHFTDTRLAVAEDSDRNSSPLPLHHRLSFGTPGKAVFKLPPEHAAVIGALQRMILSCPEKAAHRSAVIDSICGMVDALIGVMSSRRSRIAKKTRSDVTSTESPQQEFLVDSEKLAMSDVCSLNKLISFIVNCSQSQKIPRRAFSVEIAFNLLQSDSLWAACISDGANAAEGLLLAILNRCKDIAPSVRAKALSGFCDLLDTLGAMLMDHRSYHDGATQPLSELTDGQVELCRCFYKLAISESESHHSGSFSEKNSLNAMDSLKLLISDDKASTRVKALRAYSTALSIKWPQRISQRADHLNATKDSAEASQNPDLVWGNQRGGDSTLTHPLPTHNRIIDKVSMLVSPDEIQILANCCTDPSIAVRKQMVDSLTDLLWSRPIDGAAQDAWIFSALPLMSDSELSIQSKVANSVMLLVIEPCVAWKNATLASQSGAAMKASFDASIVSLGWKLCCKIADSGMVKLFRGAVMSLIKDGRIGPSSGLPIKEIVRVAEIACRASDAERNRRSSDAAVDADLFFDCEEVSHGGWVLMETLLEYDKNLVNSNASLKRDFGEFHKSEFVLDCWDRRAESLSSNPLGTMLDDVRLLKALECIGISSKGFETGGERVQQNKLNSSEISKSDRFHAICKQIFDHLSELRCPAHAVSPALNVVLSLFNSVASSKKSINECIDTSEFKQLLTRCGKLLNIAYSVLHKVVMSGKPPTDGLWGHRSLPLPKGPSTHDADCVGTVPITIIHSALMVIGEVSMLGYSKDEDDSFVVFPSATSSESVPQYALSRLGSPTYKILIPESLTKVLQMLMLDHLPALTHLEDFNESEAHSSRWSTGTSGSLGDRAKVPASVRAFAFVTMGKLCIREKSKASRYVNIFLRELQVSSGKSSSCNASVRSNALLVLGDLCVRFTNLVDRHIGVLAACLQDEDVSVRRHAFVLLIQLLLQDFLKWRGMLLYRFLAAVVDSDQDMADFARMALKKTVESKFNGIFKQHFIESIVIYNNCTCHPMYAAAETSGGSDAGESHVDLNGINLMGAENRDKRRMIYEFIMDGMAEEDKIQATAKVVQDILAFAVDNPEYVRSPIASGSAANGSHLSPLEESLMDCFYILESPLLKIGSRRSNRGAEGEEDGGGEVDGRENAKMALQEAKLKVIKKLSVQHMVDHVLPVIASLKHVLERCRSSLQKPLMGYLVKMIKNHKDEVDRALSGDPSLKAEIEYEIRLYDKEKEQEAVRASLIAAESAAELALSLTPAAPKSTKKALPVSISASARRLAVQSALKSPTLKKSHSKLTTIDAMIDDSESADTSFIDNLASVTSSPSDVTRRWSIRLGGFDSENIEPQNKSRDSSGSTTSSNADKGEFPVPRGSMGTKGSAEGLDAQRKNRSGNKAGSLGASGVTPLKKKSRAAGSPAAIVPVTAVFRGAIASENAPPSTTKRGRGSANGGDSLMSMFN